MEYYHNPGKALEIEVAGERYLRHGIRTHFVEVGEDYLDLFRRYVVPVYRPGDWVAVSEKVAALCQGRVIHRQEIQVTWLARLLAKCVRQTPAGPGMGLPVKMQFALDQEGWSFSGDSRIEERNGSKAAVIGKKGSISQDLDGRIPGSSRIHVEFYAEAENGGASVTVQLGGDEQTIHVGEGKTYRMEFESLPRYTFSITAERRIHVDDIRVYTYEQNGRIYERDGSAGDLAGDFRTLNGELAAGSAPAGGMAAGTPDAGEVHSGQQPGEVTATEAPSAAAE